MKVLYLFSGSRLGLLDKIKKGENHGHGFWGMIQLPHFGVDADYVEVEQYFPFPLSKLIRKFFSAYNTHIFLFWKFFSYDIIFTSAAFGSQFLHALLRIKKPLWVMHDFSIVSLLGEGKTIKQKLFKYAVNKCAGVVTLSMNEKHIIEKRFKHLRGKVEFIPFGADLNFFKPYKLKEKQQILAVGFDPDRDWKTLIKACKNINTHVVLATRESRVKPYLPLPHNFEICQFSARDLVSEYDKSAIIVIPLNTSNGVNDAMGCSALFEAMAMGKAIIATRTRAMESYITHGKNGLLVDEGDSQKMTEAINLLLNNSELRASIGKNAREYALENLDIEKCTAKLAEFFKKL
ncbi:MAG: glycosyltransferase family 4 protein [bacterium]|nr:glycosyltransferase family 4 protein [bacterium]